MENPAYWVQRSSQIPHPVKFPESRAVFAQMPDPGIPFQTQTRQNFFPRFLQKILEIPLVLGFWIWRSRRECFKVETDLSRCLFFSVLPSCFSRVYSISGFRWVSTQHHGCPRSSFALFWDNHGLQTRTPQISSSLRSKSDSKFDFAVIRDAIGLKVWRHFFDQSKTIRDLFTRGFPRLAPLYVFLLNSDWFVGLSAFSVIGFVFTGAVLVMKTSTKSYCDRCDLTIGMEAIVEWLF